VKAVATKQDAKQLTRDLLAWRLFLAYLAADEAGYPFRRSELNALRNVSAWPVERLKRAAEYYEQFG
jgi:hypothetical protein